MINVPNTTTYSASFPPLSRQKQANTDRLPVIVPVGFASNYLFGDRRLKRGPPLSERLRDARRSISLGLGTPRYIRTIHWSTAKPIVRSLRPQDVPTTILPAAAAAADKCGGAAARVAGSDSIESIESVNEEGDQSIDWDELAIKRRYTSVTANAGEEGIIHLPSPPAKQMLSSTFETDCDPVRNEVSWTEWKLPRPISIVWDRMHTRVTDGITAAKTQTAPLPRISLPSRSNPPKPIDNISQCINKQLIFYRSDPIPGYTGYQPHLPVVSRLDYDHMMSIARTSYKKLPSYEYQLPQHPHQAPFSKMISLITPHNAFNRIQATEPLKL